MDIQLNLTLDEVNVALTSLAKQPYESVAPTIAKIRQQAIGQVDTQPVQEQSSTGSQLLTED